MGWRSPEAPRGQQQRGYSDRIYSERNRDLVGARVVEEAKGNEKLGFATASNVFEALQTEVALRLPRWSYLSQWWLLAYQAADDTSQQLACLGCFV